MDFMGELFTAITYHHRLNESSYLGTRYTLLCTFIVFIDSDGPKVPCHVRLTLLNWC
jgi:hypothetical protein